MLLERPADFTIFRISDFLVKNIHGVFSLIFYALSEKVKTPLTKQLEITDARLLIGSPNAMHRNGAHNCPLH